MKPNFHGKNILWFGTEGCLFPQYWAQQNPDADSSRLFNREQIHSQLMANDLMGYDADSPFVLAEVNGKMVRVIPAIEFTKEAVLADGQWLYVDHKGKLAQRSQQEMELLSASDVPKTRIERLIDHFGVRHGFDFCYANERGIYGLNISYHRNADFDQKVKAFSEKEAELSFTPTLVEGFVGSGKLDLVFM
jgi:hypothetical protein